MTSLINNPLWKKLFDSLLGLFFSSYTIAAQYCTTNPAIILYSIYGTLMLSVISVAEDQYQNE